MITPSDIVNPSVKSGYKGVRYAPTGTNGKPFQANIRVKPGKNGILTIATRRATAAEAAQDYCDYVNNAGVGASTFTLNTAGHTGRRESLPSDPEVVAALGVLRDARGDRRGRQGYVYLIAETLDATPLGVLQGTNRNPLLVKIGYSTNPQARLAEIQTSNGRILKLLAYFKGTKADENRLHAKFRHLNTVQEWFRPTVALLSEFGLYADGSAVSRRAA